LESKALGVRKAYLAYLPGGYDASARRYPVIYLLHGLGGDETNWVKVGGLPGTADALGLQAIVVMPDGDDGFYANWATPAAYDACLAERPPFNRGERPETYCVREGRYEDYIVQDLVAHVDATFRTVADRKGRALAGLSMGGYGALALAMRHKDAFSATASHSGLVSLLYGGPHPYAPGKAGPATSLAGWGGEYRGAMREHMMKIFGGELAAWRARDPSQLAQSLAAGDLAMYIDCGTEDGFKFQDQALYLHEVLESRRVQHAFALVPGGHDFSLWKARIRESLAFHADHFRRAGL
jgi:S-formylglutathione hydrolase FrmB